MHFITNDFIIYLSLSVSLSPPTPPPPTPLFLPTYHPRLTQAVPFHGNIKEGMAGGKMVFLQGFCSPESQGFLFALRCIRNTMEAAGAPSLELHQVLNDAS